MQHDHERNCQCYPPKNEVELNSAVHDCHVVAEMNGLPVLRWLSCYLELHDDVVAHTDPGIARMWLNSIMKLRNHNTPWNDRYDELESGTIWVFYADEL